MSTHQELVGIGSSGLAHEHPGSGLQLHLIRRPLDAPHLRVRVTVQVEHHALVPDADGEAGPGVPHGGHLEASGLVRLLRVGLGVVQDDVLVAALHGRQLHGHIHDLLRGVGDREDHAALAGGGLQVEEEGEVPVEGAGQVGAGQLARVGVRAEDVGGEAVGPVDPGDLAGGRVPDQLQQRDAAVFWRKRREEEGEATRR